MPTKQYQNPVFHVPGSIGIIDNAVDRDGTFVTEHSGETIEELQITRPQTALAEWSDVYDAMLAACKTEPIEITEEQFLKALYVLPPVAWVNISGAESFKMSERTCGLITAIYARIGQRYFSYSDKITTPHETVINRIVEKFPTLAPR